MAMSAKDREQQIKQMALLALAGGAMLAGGGGAAMGARSLAGGGITRGGVQRAFTNTFGNTRGQQMANEVFRTTHGLVGGNGIASGGGNGGGHKKKKQRVDTPIEAAKRMAYLQRPLEPDYANVMPSGINYDVKYFPGEPQENALLNRGGEYDEALDLQTPEQHRAALDKYVPDTNWDLDTAIRMGEEHEKSLPQFYRLDSHLRRPVNPSSSCISSIRVDGNAIYCKFGKNPKEYIYGLGCETFRDATEAAKELILSDSIGRAINPKHGWWRMKYHLN